MLQAGSKAPLFTLEDLGGVRHSLSSFLERGPVILALFKISCPICQLALPFLERIATGGSLQVVAISQDDKSATERFHQKFGITMLTLLDREEEGYPASNAFGIAYVPSLFLVEPDGMISLVSEGFVKRDIEAIGERAAFMPFRSTDAVPAWKAG